MKRAFWVALAVYGGVFVFNVVKPLPEGISVSGPLRDGSSMEFLYDLTYRRQDQAVMEQRIFDRVFAMVDSAEAFVVLDMFLFNGEVGGEREYRSLSSELTDHLVARKATRPDLAIVFVTDEINNFYGAYTSPEIRRLREAGIQVVITRMSRLRDSNPTYSAAWRMLLSWFGTAGPGWLPHPLSRSGRRVTARSYFKLLNFKANHRKLLVTEKGCLVSSANPHDASSFHSNIAFAGRGSICRDLLESERSVVAFSGGDPAQLPSAPAGDREANPSASVRSGGQVQLVTEGKILEVLLADLWDAGDGDQVDMGMFYLSDRRVVDALVEAQGRGARVRLVLDPNKDAFGREKGGIPNRQVAEEFVTRSEGGITVRWYDTRGEQFHTKLVRVVRGDSVTILGGSANLTRRNVGDYNLETDLRFQLSQEAPLARAVEGYFNRLFDNRDGEYTLPYEAFRDTSVLRRLVYRTQEFSGLSSY